MNTLFLSIAHAPRLRAAFRYGRGMSGRLHVSTSAREAVRYAAGRLKFSRGLPYAQRQDRRALYLGVIAGLRAERRLMAAFNL